MSRWGLTSVNTEYIRPHRVPISDNDVLLISTNNVLICFCPRVAFLITSMYPWRADVDAARSDLVHTSVLLRLNQNAPQHFQDYKFLEQAAEAKHGGYFEPKSEPEINRPLFFCRGQHAAT